MSAPPTIAYFDADGGLLLFAQGGVMDAPPGTAFTVEAPDLITGEVWLDTDTQTIMPKTPFAVTYAGNVTSGIPQGARAATDQGIVTVNSGVLDLTGSQPGVVRLTHPKHTTLWIQVLE